MFFTQKSTFELILTLQTYVLYSSGKDISNQRIKKVKIFTKILYLFSMVFFNPGFLYNCLFKVGN